MRKGRRLIVAAVLVTLTIAAALLLADPPPPRRIVLATGQPDGMYDSFGRQYRDQLRALGLDVHLLPTNGSLDNLRRLSRGDVDVAFVQSGIASLVPEAAERVRGIAALYLEPLWVFHRVAGLTTLGDLRGRRLGVGPAASGTEAVARALLREHGIGDGALLNLTAADQRARLQDGSLDAAFFVTSYRDQAVVALLHDRRVALLGFPQAAAYLRRVPGLASVTIAEGLLDLQAHVPPHEVTLLAPAALLMSRAQLHPRAVELLLTVAHRIHASGSLIDEAGRFPSLRGIDVPVHEAAEVYLTQGSSWLSRTLPYGLLRWALPVRILIISLVVWIPLLRALPEISKWRTERRLARRYTSLWEIESSIAAAKTPWEIDEHLERLEALMTATGTEAGKITRGKYQQLYDWRAHVGRIRDEAVARRATLPGPTRRQRSS
jgi:uncharacterized protein